MFKVIRSINKKFLKLTNIYCEQGFFAVFKKVFQFIVFYLPFVSDILYFLWIKKNEIYNKNILEKEILDFTINPIISIIMPVYNISPEYLNKAIESVLSQFYSSWELCIYDDASTNKETIEALIKWKEKKDSRIKIKFGLKNGHISYASNQAISLATGKYITFLDHDDELASSALYEIVKIINENQDIKFIYSDSDKLTKFGKRVFPVFKPDWSLDLLLTNMYVCHLSVYLRERVVGLGGLRIGYEGAQDYDLALRYLENILKKDVYHIRRILYHWRMIETSTSGSNSLAKPYAEDAGKRALEDYVKRSNINAIVEKTKVPFIYKIKIMSI